MARIEVLEWNLEVTKSFDAHHYFKMKGTEVLTLCAVGVLNLCTEVHVHTTKLFWPATYMSSWAGYFSRLAMVAPPVKWKRTT